MKTKQRPIEIQEKPDFEEMAFRRGYHHGFLAAKNTDVTEKEITDWRYGSKDIAPPGSPWEGSKF